VLGKCASSFPVAAGAAVYSQVVKTAVVVDRRYEDHDPGPGHPESPKRIRTILDVLESYRRSDILVMQPRPATAGEIALNHDPRHIEHVAASAGRPVYSFDADTPTSPRSFVTALLAAGGYLTLLEAIMAADADSGFAFVRPPGHHAEADRAMARVLMRVACDHAQGRLAAVLEGGYDMQALRAAVPAVLDELGGARMGEALGTPCPRSGVLDAARRVHRDYWEL
jgi:acetoin utilization deacetylase AcuC-like enzyme